MKQTNSFVTGLIAGVLVTLALTVFFRASHRGQADPVVAEVAGEKLSLSELRKQAASDLVPIENDEYRILKSAAETWVQARLLEKAAKDEGMSLEELHQKKLWSQVRVSDEKGGPLRAQELRRKKYAEAREKYLKEIGEKYQARIHLAKPKSYVEGLALPAPVLEKEAETETLLPPGAPPARGSQNAPIKLVEFADFHCGFCKKIKPTLGKLLENYPNEIQWVFRHFPLSQTPGEGSFLTHEASVCAQEQGKFWEYHDAILESPSSPTRADLDALAEKTGLNLTQFQECLKSGKYQDFLKSEVKEGNQKGVEGTPTAFLNDRKVGGAYPYEHFAGLVENILDPTKAPPPSPEADQRPPAPSEPVEFKDLKDRPSRGAKDATVTLVEFSDFHCPFCKRVTPTLEKLEKNYAGQIRRVWRHYPLAFHQGADRTHEASECAHEQGKFWEYHDQLFETQDEARDDPALIRLAESAGLNKKKFEKCLSEGKYKSLIQKEIAAGDEAGVRGTPAVFVNGELVSGAQPYESFDAIIKTKLRDGSR